MKSSFREFDFNYKLYLRGADTWTCRPLGKGELESDNHGRSRDTSFSQETVKGKVQWQSRIECRPALLKVQDARGFLTHLPLFFQGLRKDSKSNHTKECLAEFSYE
ncbi:MAG: hypothetical protein CL677_10100 [Bdellovibrionaceae bacterium]|nr:hypothetical protein [Pseudobdellovibrionaceae bacterium]|tara:strand:+ start:235 stop:552 length:318 start_codon:yes stop_codon:yes gene_type:complete